MTLTNHTLTRSKAQYEPCPPKTTKMTYTGNGKTQWVDEVLQIHGIITSGVPTSLIGSC